MKFIFKALSIFFWFNTSIIFADEIKGSAWIGRHVEDGDIQMNQPDETSKNIMYELLVHVGSDPNISNEDLVTKQFVAMSDAIASDVEDGIGEFIANHFVRCIEEFPMKTSIYCSLFAMVNIVTPEFCDDIFNGT